MKRTLFIALMSLALVGIYAFAQQEEEQMPAKSVEWSDNLYCEAQVELVNKVDGQIKIDKQKAKSSVVFKAVAHDDGTISKDASGSFTFADGQQLRFNASRVDNDAAGANATTVNFASELVQIVDEQNEHQVSSAEQVYSPAADHEKAIAQAQANAATAAAASEEEAQPVPAPQKMSAPSLIVLVNTLSNNDAEALAQPEGTDTKMSVAELVASEALPSGSVNKATILCKLYTKKNDPGGN